jgi:ABC-2 type transport system permease protein
MSRIANLAWLNLLQVFKDRMGLLTLILLPLMLTALFGTVMGGGERRIAVAVADLDASVVSSEVVAALDESSYAVTRTDERRATAMASSGEAAAALIIPKGFASDVLEGVDARVRVLKDPRSNSSIAILEAVRGRVQRVAANAATIRIVRAAFRDATAATGAHYAAPPPADVYGYADRIWSPDPPLSVSDVAVTVAKVRGAATQAMGFQQYSMGFTLMFMMFMGLGAAGGFIDEREEGTLARLLTTPTTRTELVAGKVAGIYLTVLFEAVIMVGMGAFLFRVPWGDDPLGVVLILTTFGLATTGLGVMISTLARTRGQVSALTAVLATALSMLGGSYWPLDIVGPTMRTIALLTPTGWAMTGLTNIVVRSQGPVQAVLPSSVLLGMAALFLAVGISRLRLE